MGVRGNCSGRNRLRESERKHEHPCAIGAQAAIYLVETKKLSVQSIMGATERRCEGAVTAGLLRQGGPVRKPRTAGTGQQAGFAVVLAGIAGAP